MLGRGPRRRGRTVGADRRYDVGQFVDGCRALGVTPHVAARSRHSRLDGRTTRHAGYAVSQRRRRRVEEPFGWIEDIRIAGEAATPGPGEGRLAVSIHRGRLQHRAIAGAGDVSGAMDGSAGPVAGRMGGRPSIWAGPAGGWPGIRREGRPAASPWRACDRPDPPQSRKISTGCYLLLTFCHPYPCTASLIKASYFALAKGSTI